VIVSIRTAVIAALFSSTSTLAVAGPAVTPAGPLTRASIAQAVQAHLAERQAPAPPRTRPTRPTRKDSNTDGIVIGAIAGAAAGPLIVAASGGSDAFWRVSFTLGGVFGGLGAMTGYLIDAAH
jgi:hypothetical protein